MEILGGYVKRYLHFLCKQGCKKGIGTSGCCAVVLGTTTLEIAVLRIVTTITQITETTTMGFG
jgi:hypothetical protein